MDACVENPSRLRALGCDLPWEALLCLPKGHIDKRGAYTSVSRATMDRLCVFKARLENAQGYDRNDKLTRSPFPAYLKVELQFADALVSSRVYGKGVTEFMDLVGEVIVFEASVSRFKDRWFMRFHALTKVSGRVEPIYSGRQGQVSGEEVQAAVSEALDQDCMGNAVAAIENSPAIMECLTRAGRTASWLITSLHSPASLAAGDESLALARAAAIAEVKSTARPTRQVLSSPYCLDDALVELVKAQPEVLSDAQRRALNAIRKGVNAMQPAHILLNGDVGSGKTLVFMLALAAIAKTSRKPVAVMVPSDLVARQIYTQAHTRFPDLLPCLVNGDPKTDATEQELSVSRMFIGTQALLFRKLPPLEAVVVDEQHKLSVGQRTALLGSHTHIIEASATPIPRSLALALFDGWTYATIDHCPVQKRIHNHIIDNDSRSVAVSLVHKHISAGRKVIFLYPLVKGAGNSVLTKGEDLKKHFDGRVAILHGSLTPAQKIQALEEFKSGEKPIIVSSTAIEVGVDVPDVGLMIVSGADRFGTAQLHQLRGRLVRQGGEGDFVMIKPAKLTARTQKRLDAVAANNDGFELAQRDLELRGFGELLGEMQTGGAKTLFKLARLEAADFLA